MAAHVIARDGPHAPLKHRGLIEAGLQSSHRTVRGQELDARGHILSNQPLFFAADGFGLMSAPSAKSSRSTDGTTSYHCVNNSGGRT
jgi:hypothetical protein